MQNTVKAGINSMLLSRQPHRCLSLIPLFLRLSHHLAALILLIHTSLTRNDYFTSTTTTLHPFNGLCSRTTWVSWHQKGKTFRILLEQEMMWWQWHQLDHMQIICTSLQTDNHASTSPLSLYGPDALPAAQPTASKH